MELELITNIFNNYNSNAKEYSIHCPFCNHHKDKLSINTSTGNWHCWVCNTAGHTLFQLYYKYIKYINAKFDINTYNKIKKFISDNNIVSQSNNNYIPNNALFKCNNHSIKIKLPENTKNFTYSNTAIVEKEYLAYLYKRNITKYLIQKYNIMYNPNKYSLIFPSFDSTNSLNHYVEKNINPYSVFDKTYSEPKNNKSDIIFYESFINYNWPIILVEGVFDAISLNTNCIPLLGKKIYSKLLHELVLNNMINDKPIEVYIFLDNDANIDAINISKLLTSYNIKNYICGINDINYISDYNTKIDINDLNHSQLFSIINNKHTYDFELELKALLQ